MLPLSFPILGGRDLTKALQSSPFQKYKNLKKSLKITFFNNNRLLHPLVNSFEWTLHLLATGFMRLLLLLVTGFMRLLHLLIPGFVSILHLLTDLV